MPATTKMTSGSVQAVDITVCGVTAGYHLKNGSYFTAIKDISLEVPQGHICCVIGPSGCGKTTLLNCIAQLETEYEGEIHFDDLKRSQGVAMIAQESALLPWRTVLQNACLGMELTSVYKDYSAREKAIARSSVRRNLAVRFGLAGAEDSFPEQLSGGMRQRVAVAQAFEAKPRILLCDEPFSAIDFLGRVKLSREFKNLCRVHSLTTVMVTHNIEEALYLGDSVVVLAGSPGQVAKVVTPGNFDSVDPIACRLTESFQSKLTEIWEILEQYA